VSLTAATRAWLEAVRAHLPDADGVEPPEPIYPASVLGQARMLTAQAWVAALLDMQTAGPVVNSLVLLTPLVEDMRSRAPVLREWGEALLDAWESALEAVAAGASSPRLGILGSQLPALLGISPLAPASAYLAEWMEAAVAGASSPAPTSSRVTPSEAEELRDAMIELRARRSRPVDPTILTTLAALARQAAPDDLVVVAAANRLDDAVAGRGYSGIQSPACEALWSRAVDAPGVSGPVGLWVWQRLCAGAVADDDVSAAVGDLEAALRAAGDDAISELLGALQDQAAGLAEAAEEALSPDLGDLPSLIGWIVGLYLAVEVLKLLARSRRG